MKVTAFLVREKIHVLELTDIIDGEDAVLDAGRIALHPGLVVASKKPVDVEADEVL